LFQILPYLEQNNVWLQTNAGSVNQAIINAIGSPIKTYSCPARGGPRVIIANSWYGPAGDYAHAMTDYGGSDLENNGAIVYCTQGVGPTINLLAIIDGTSNTILGGEKQLDPRDYTAGIMESDDNEGYSDGWDWDVMRYSTVAPSKDIPGVGPTGAFGGIHTGGFMAVFCDGSVKMISYNIQLGTIELLCNRSDGQVVPPY
jgi:prepilin-type processing-associated H-X9-DG protein